MAGRWANLMSVEHRTNNATKDRGKNRGVLLRVPDLAARLNVSESWIYKRLMSKEAREKHGIAGGPIPCRYLGGVVVFVPHDIDAWLKQQPRRRRKRVSQKSELTAGLNDRQCDRLIKLQCHKKSSTYFSRTNMRELSANYLK